MATEEWRVVLSEESGGGGGSAGAGPATSGSQQKAAEADEVIKQAASLGFCWKIRCRISWYRRRYSFRIPND
jgi:hypothetical protein